MVTSSAQSASPPVPMNWEETQRVFNDAAGCSTFDAAWEALVSSATVRSERWAKIPSVFQDRPITIKLYQFGMRSVSFRTSFFGKHKAWDKDFKRITICENNLPILEVRAFPLKRFDRYKFL